MSTVEPTDDGHSLTPEEKAGLDRCLDEPDRDPGAGETWETIRDQALRGRAANGVGVRRAFPALLHGDRLEWTGPRPMTRGPVEVTVTLDEDPEPGAGPGRAERGRRMADALRRIADSDHQGLEKGAGE